jgi:hypothetical protein
MVDLTKKKTLSEYDTEALIDGDTVVTYRSTNAVGDKVFRGDITEGTAASISDGTSTHLKMYSDSELKSVMNSILGSETEVWTGSESSLDLTSIGGGYPGDGLYRVVYDTNKSTTMYFRSGVACYQSARVSHNGFSILSVDAVEKDAAEVLTAKEYREGGSIVLLLVKAVYKIGI